ncbi:hypothetical protein TRFO_26843 [Tritrichomonas foetus]|uniref:Sphingomyelin synthase-like domain-containing protein n=1 Tax=Tritrichomonas foetus TaxID=1144522 RepID=A0A1J4K1V7_9EUKA|nr:hypothetical protein TRFO_26843 [Tritrichomonas foetus]|eukprot:OHT05425.1 hypothetical protein TRFO_26843 [Tritrichomonas foetus]
MQHFKDHFKNYIASDCYVTPKKLFRAFFSKRSMFLFAWFVFAIYSMNICNAYVYSRMPIESPLPDILADSWKNYAYLRKSKTYMSRQPADSLSVVLTASCILVAIFRWDIINVPKLAFTYNICLHLRVLFFSVTGLPPACIGYPNCPCAVVPYATISRLYSVPKIAFIYSFALGLFLGSVPQCGDLTMSGHTIYLWVLALFLTDALDKIFTGRILILIKLIIYVLLLFVTLTIILIRNHYTIDILLATIFTNMLWTLYGWMANLSNFNHHDFTKTYAGKFIGYLEKRMEDPDDDATFSSASDI